MDSFPLLADELPVDSVNTPIGVAKGCHPGRVVWVHDRTSTYQTGDPGFLSEDKIN
jgi:hypothetical protein